MNERFEDKTAGEVWAELPRTEPIPLWDVESGRFIADMDYAEELPESTFRQIMRKIFE